jgi:hypothetical protein
MMTLINLASQIRVIAFITFCIYTDELKNIIDNFMGINICIGFAAIMWQLVEKPSIKLSQKVKLVKNTEAIRV